MRGGLTSRILVASLVLIAIVGAWAAFSLVATLAGRDSDLQVEHSLEELTLVSDLEKLVLDLETGVRGFVITRDEQFLEPWEAARAAFPGRAQELVRLTDDPVEDPLARQIAARVESYIDDYAVPLVDAARRNDPTASSVAATEDGMQRVDAIRADVDRYQAIERATLARREATATSNARREIVAATGALIASVFLLAVFAIYFYRAIVLPVRRAATMAGRVATGDLSARMPETAVGEIGSLERSFNTMARSLEANRDELTRLLEEQAALRRVATLVARGVPPSEIFTAVAEEARRVVRADTSTVARFEPDGATTIVVSRGRDEEALPAGLRWDPSDALAPTVVFRSGRAARVDSADFGNGSSQIAQDLRQHGVRTAVASPITVEDRAWGVLIVSTNVDPLPPDTEERLTSFTELVATTIANAEGRAELAASRARVVAASDETRRRIERDLHDGTQQRLVSLELGLRGASAMVPPGLPDLSAQLSQVSRGLAATVEELQQVSRGIHPAILSRGGLGPALKILARRSAVPVELELRTDGRLPAQIEVALYYVASEALTNAAKHAQASIVHIDLDVNDTTVALSIRDDGVGGAEDRSGTGLVGLRDRIEALGGRIVIESPPGGGTTLRVRIPLDQS